MNITFDAKTLDLLVRLSDGSLRDALAIVEQVSNLGNELKYEEIAELMGVTAEDSIYETIDAIINKNYVKAIKVIDEVVTSGKDILYYSMDILQYFRNMLVIKNAQNEEELKAINCPEWVVEKIKKNINNLTNEEIMKFIDVFYNVEKDIKGFIQPKKALEVAVIKCIEIKNEKDDTKEIVKKLNDISITLATIKLHMKTEKIKEQMDKKDNIKENKETIAQDEEQKVKGINKEELYEKWNKFLDYLKNNKLVTLRTLLQNGRLKSINGKIVIAFEKKFEFAITKLKEEKNEKALSEALNKHFNKELKIEYVIE